MTFACREATEPAADNDGPTHRLGNCRRLRAYQSLSEGVTVASMRVCTVVSSGVRGRPRMPARSWASISPSAVSARSGGRSSASTSGGEQSRLADPLLTYYSATVW